LKNGYGDEMHDRLCRLLAGIDDAGDMKNFLEDLCTINEIRQLSQRAECACLLLAGETYGGVTEKTGVSSATLSRVSKCLRYGSGGYKNVLPSLLEKQSGE